jgi:acetyl-CoA acetyltransferase
VRAEESAIIAGIGQSKLSRHVPVDPLSLTIESAMAAIFDAGLTPNDIDGVSCQPGLIGDMPGMSPVSIGEVRDALDLKLSWYTGAREGPGHLVAIFNACAAIAAGLANNVLCFRTVLESTGRAGLPAAVTTASSVVGRDQYSIPLGAVSAASRAAMFAQRYMFEYGLTREQLGLVSINARRNAGLNAKAIYRDPLDLDTYLNARQISSPFCLYDCDVPIDGSVAFVLSRRERTADIDHPAVGIAAIGSALADAHSWTQRREFLSMGSHDSASMMWRRTDLKPTDVDVVQLYDGFSIFPILWLEALGFVGRGEAGQFLEAGHHFLSGRLPMNTSGGQLAEGRLHGLGLLHEACVQLRGTAGERQVPLAEVAVVATGGGPDGGCLTLTKGIR